MTGDGTPSMDIESNGRLFVAGFAASTCDMVAGREQPVGVGDTKG